MQMMEELVRPDVLKEVIYSEGTIYLTEKHIDLIKDKTRFQIMEGKTGSSKSIIGGIAAFHRIFNAPKEHNQFAICATSIDTLERMVVDNSASFFNVYNKACIYKRSGIGGARFEISTPTGVKKLYLVGYDNKARYKKILGLTIHGFIMEEAHVAPDGFVSELFTRLYRDDGWLYATMNAGLPDQMVYVDYFNKARPSEKYTDDVPMYMWEELLQKEPDEDFRYWFFRFEDNPTMTDLQIHKLWGSHPEGSYEYNSKVLARRGFVEGLLYARLLANVKEMRLEQLKKENIDRVYIGIDIGDTAKTVFVMIGTNRNADKIYVIDTKEVKSKYEEQDYTSIIKAFDEFVLEYDEDYGHLINQVRIDRSSPLFVTQIRNNSKFKFSYQKSKSDKITDRIKLKQQLLFQERVVVSNTHGSAKLINALKRVRSDGKDGHVDDNTPEIDYSDAFDYALEPISFRLGSTKLG